MQREKGPYSVQAVLKAFDLLDQIAHADSGSSIPELAEALGVSRNKVFRILATLEARGLVERDEHSGTYSLGLGSFELAQNLLKGASLIRFAQPVIEQLARKHDEAVYIAVMSNDEVLFLDMVDSCQQIKTVPLVGQRFPFFNNAVGKAMKAMTSFDFLDRISKRWGKKAGMPDLQELEEELLDIRKKGFAFDVGGLGEGVCAVAVAVRDYSGKVIGSLAMMAPSFRMNGERLRQEIIPSMQDGAEALSMKFGYIKIPV